MVRITCIIIIGNTDLLPTGNLCTGAGGGLEEEFV